MDDLPTDPSSPVTLIPGNTVSDTANLAQYLDVQVQKLTEMLALIAANRLWRL